MARHIEYLAKFIMISLLFCNLAIITMPVSVQATTYKNIVCDGNLSDWSADEILGVDGNCKFYLTWNSTHISAAWEGIDLANGDVYIAFDENPNVQSGVSAIYGGATFAGPNLPEFAIWVKAGLEPVVYQAHNLDNSAWGPVENPAWDKYGGWSDVKNTELSIPRSYLGIAGDPTKPIGVWMWTTTEPGTGDLSVTSTYPTTNPKGANVQFTYCKVYQNTLDGVSPGDSTKPAIVNVNVQPTNNSAKITVESSEPTTLVLEYGTTTTYGQTLTNNTFAETHIFTISGLSEGKTYHFRINATDSAGNYNLSADYTFSTLGGIRIIVNSPTEGQTITTRRFTISANVSSAQTGISSVFAIIDGLEHSMQLSGTDWIYEWSSYSNGAHTIKIKATDTNGITSEVTVSVTVSLGINHGPTLLGTKVEPSSGDVLTNFEFMCDYLDEDGDKPVKIVVIIDGLEYNMSTTDTDFVNGAHYTYVTKLTKGEHVFKFFCDDGAGSQDSQYESSEYKLKVKSSSLQNTVDEKAEFCQSITLCYIIPLLAFIGCAILIESMMPKLVEKFPILKKFTNKK